MKKNTQLNNIASQKTIKTSMYFNNYSRGCFILWRETLLAGKHFLTVPLMIETIKINDKEDKNDKRKNFF